MALNRSEILKAAREALSKMTPEEIEEQMKRIGEVRKVIVSPPVEDENK